GHYSNHNGWISEESKTSYVFLCGSKYPYEYWTLNTVTEEHLKHCNICKVLTGSKRKTGFTQYEVNELFKLGITDKSSSSKNFESDENKIFHYRTIEKMRLIDNTIVDNSQCWSAGFSHCEARLGKASIPLTSLQSIGDIDTIRILDVKDSVLFTIKSMIRHYDPTDEYKVKEVIKRTFETKYLLFGHDDG